MSLTNYLLQTMDISNIDFNDMWNTAYAEGRDSVDIEEVKTEARDEGHEVGFDEGYDSGYSDGKIIEMMKFLNLVSAEKLNTIISELEEESGT